MRAKAERNFTATDPQNTTWNADTKTYDTCLVRKLLEHRTKRFPLQTAGGLISCLLQTGQLSRQEQLCIPDGANL